MTLMRITLNLAFQDIEGTSLDAIRSRLVDKALDDLNAEVAFTSGTQQWGCRVTDPDYDADDADKQWKDWDDRARTELDQPMGERPAGAQV